MYQNGNRDGDGAVYVNRNEPIYVDRMGHRDRDDHGHLDWHGDGHW